MQTGGKASMGSTQTNRPSIAGGILHDGSTGYAVCTKHTGSLASTQHERVPAPMVGSSRKPIATGRHDEIQPIRKERKSVTSAQRPLAFNLH